MTDDGSELEALCRDRKVTAEPRVSYEEPPANFKDAQCWRVMLRYQGRRMTVPFYQGSAHTKPPTAADVLGCLCSDATSVEQASSFEDWCGEYGYDTDSRKAETTFRACERIARKLHAFLGEDFETFCRAEH